MTIDKIGSTSNIKQKSNIKNNNKISKLGSDRVEISDESRIALQNEKLVNIIKESSDIRQDKVADAKKRLELYMKDGALREEVINSIANSIIDSMPLD